MQAVTLQGPTGLVGGEPGETFHSLVLRGKIWNAVRWIAERDKGIVMQPGGALSKTGGPVLDVLWSKHPESRALSAISLEAYPGQPPKLVPVNLTEDKVI